VNYCKNNLEFLMTIPFDTCAVAASGVQYLPYSLVVQTAAVAAAGWLGHFNWETVKDAFFPTACGDLNEWPVWKKIVGVGLQLVEKTLTVSGEEILIRGILQDGILTKLPKKVLDFFGRGRWVNSPLASVARVGVSAAAFSAIHLGNALLLPRKHMQLQLANTFGLGLVAAYIKEKTGSIWPGFGLHAAYNAIATNIPFVHCVTRASEPAAASTLFKEERSLPRSGSVLAHPACAAENQQLINRAGRIDEQSASFREDAARLESQAEQLREQAQSAYPRVS
jgi:hypothetical protein